MNAGTRCKVRSELSARGLLALNERRDDAISTLHEILGERGPRRFGITGAQGRDDAVVPSGTFRRDIDRDLVEYRPDLEPERLDHREQQRALGRFIDGE